MTRNQTNADKLNLKLVGYLERHWPQWAGSIQTLRDEATDQRYVVLRIPDPENIQHEQPLEITTWGEELTVSFDATHRHFPWPLGFDGSDSLFAAFEYVKDILDEKIIVGSVSSGGRLKLVSDLKVDSLGKYPRNSAGDHEVRIASWCGTYNEIFFVDWHEFLKASAP